MQAAVFHFNSLLVIIFFFSTFGDETLVLTLYVWQQESRETPGLKMIYRQSTSPPPSALEAV